ncbi:GNAT family N-acetyltransferase [Micromonospora zhanjiangensis]|uniref:GNAT family N-acetyltransferase n=1 Tax=Micromonospora zhanjiangensis TaxID=1522057 RepID=A0ABV8KEL2_9ACTN
MDITVDSIRQDDHTSFERAYEIKAASLAADLPGFPPLCRQRFFGGLRHPMPVTGYRWLLARLDGEPVGFAELELPQADNTAMAVVQVHVRPGSRRRGVGRALHRRVVRLMGDLGRKRIIGQTAGTLPDGPERDPAGDAFARAVGATAALVDVRRRLDATGLDEVALDRQLAEARSRAGDYRTVRWPGIPPEEYLADLAYLDGRLLLDAPTGELDYEPEKIDATRARGIAEARVAAGRRTYHTAARHEATGRLVAWTTIDVGATPDWHAFQQITIVDPAHRGRRLGTLLKIENLRYAMANEPALRSVDTWNAADNEHMISINEAIGFRPVDRWTDWQLTL